MKKRYIIFLALILSVSVPNAKAFDFWMFPEIADRNTIFLGAFAASFAARDFFGSSSTTLADSFSFHYPELYVDYVLPFILPFSIGVSVRMLEPYLFGVALRPGYQLNFNDQNLNVYIVYSINFISGDEFALLEWGTRIGIRRRFGRFFFLNIETGFRVKSLYFGLAIKLN